MSKYKTLLLVAVVNITLLLLPQAIVMADYGLKPLLVTSTPIIDPCISDPTDSEIDNVTHYPIQIVNIDKVAESVEIKNISNSAVDLSGWYMCSIRGNQQHPLVESIDAGASIVIVNEGGFIWLNTAYDPGALWDNESNLISYFPTDVEPSTPVIPDCDTVGNLGNPLNPNWQNCQMNVETVEYDSLVPDTIRGCQSIMDANSALGIDGLILCINWVSIPDISILGLDLSSIVAAAVSIKVLAQIMSILRS